MPATFRVPARVYTEPDEFGHRTLLFPEGALIGWDDAVAAGLTDAGAVPADQVPFMVPHNLYEDEPGGARRLVMRAGTWITMAEAVEYGLVGPPNPTPEQVEIEAAQAAAAQASAEEAQRVAAEDAERAAALVREADEAAAAELDRRAQAAKAGEPRPESPAKGRGKAQP